MNLNLFNFFTFDGARPKKGLKFDLLKTKIFNLQVFQKNLFIGVPRDPKNLRKKKGKKKLPIEGLKLNFVEKK